MFDSKQKFVDALWTAFGGRTFLLGGKVTSGLVCAFDAHLKEDFNVQDSPRQFKESEHVGSHGGGSWIFSSKVKEASNQRLLAYIRLSFY